MNKKTLLGHIISTKQKKTIIVLVAKKFNHPKYKKQVIQKIHYNVHVENIICNEGDLVLIQETKPISRTKNWILKNILKY